MKYLLLGLLGWIGCFVVFSSIGLIFTITSGMYDRDDIFMQFEYGALIATSLVIVGYVLAVVIPMACMILSN